ncbi:sensor histidine kinase [Robertkochia solimangrovi]|uniref:sensor histidine kinase n=1 Tax=Robertkochia solimangrovi TaxID=2213046 RepID=UPI00117CB347|nr:histidine kinase [Robertkochia solimangrovi]TRZ42568.1 histidine kinase [Robertkochia solimangrovi]
MIFQEEVVSNSSSASAVETAVDSAASQVTFIIVYVSILIFIVIVFLISFFFAYHKRKTNLLLQQAEERRRFEEELSNAQTEIQEQTLKNVSWELHDNVGQLLSVAKMQLNMVKPKIPEMVQDSFQEASNMLGEGLKEVRMLSRSLNTDYITRTGLKEALELEINRFKRLKFINIDYKLSGEPRDLDPKDEIIIFRIFQECFSNVVKYSRAQNLEISLKYNTENMIVMVKDDGIGFNPDETESGIGLTSMKSRADLIGAALKIDAAEDKGVSVLLDYPYKILANTN